MKHLSQIVNKNLIIVFSLVASLILGFALVFTLILTHNYIQKEIINTTEASNAALTQIFINEVYPDINKYLLLKKDNSISDSKPLKKNELRIVDERIRYFIKHTDVLKVKIYNSSGLTVYSTDFKQIGQNKSSNKGFLSAKQGVNSTELSF